MKKTLKIIAVSAGIISIVSAVVLGCIYLENITDYIKLIKNKIAGRINTRDTLE